MKAVKKFKQIISHKRPARMDGILGRDTRFVQPPLSMDDYRKPSLHKSRSVETDDRQNIEQALVVEGVHRSIDAELNAVPPDRGEGTATFGPTTPSKRKSSHSASSSTHDPSSQTSPRRALNARLQDHRPPTNAQAWPITKPNDHGKGHAHDPREDHPFVGIGPGGDYQLNGVPVVSESPPSSDIDIYETAYQEQVERIRARQGRSATLFLTRRVERKPEFWKDGDLIRSQSMDTNSTPGGIARMLEASRREKEGHEEHEKEKGSGLDDTGS